MSSGRAMPPPPPPRGLSRFCPAPFEGKRAHALLTVRAAGHATGLAVAQELRMRQLHPSPPPAVSFPFGVFAGTECCLPPGACRTLSRKAGREEGEERRGEERRGGGIHQLLLLLLLLLVGKRGDGGLAASKARGVENMLSPERRTPRV